jgi:hypothetical protein
MVSLTMTFLFNPFSISIFIFSFAIYNLEKERKKKVGH